MLQAKKGDTVRVHYIGRLDDGTIFDSSEDRDPLEFTLGLGQLITGFELAVAGMVPGENKTVTIPADQAYGDYQDELRQEIPRQHFLTDIEPEVGQRFRVNQKGNEAMLVSVVEVSESSITLDANHPLAGEDLTFDIELVEIV